MICQRWTHTTSRSLFAILITGVVSVGCGLKVLNPELSAKTVVSASPSPSASISPDTLVELTQYSSTTFAAFTVAREGLITQYGLLQNTDQCKIATASELFEAEKWFRIFYKLVQAANPAEMMKIKQGTKLGMLGAQLQPFALTVGSSIYYGVEEVAPHRFGFGIVLIRRDYAALATKHLFEVPHPLWDMNTPALGGEVMDEMLPAFYIQAGLHRYCSTLYTGDTFPGNYVSGEKNLRTDPCHESSAYFQIAHSVLAPSASWVIQLHGFGSSEQSALYAAVPPVEVVISAGVSTSPPSILNTLKTQFTLQGPNAAKFPADTSALGAQTNVQGELTRALLGNKFVHIETRTELRANATERRKIVLSVKGAFP